MKLVGETESGGETMKWYYDISNDLVMAIGKPTEEDFNNKEELFDKLLELDCLSTTEENPYFDISILKGNKDITNEIFKVYKKFKKLKEFEQMKATAELKALSKYSLENPLNDKQYKRFMELGEKMKGGLI